MDQPFLEQYGSWALVTGSARAAGIGFGFAQQLAGKGLNIALVDLLADELTLRAGTLAERFFVKTRCIALDLGAADSLEQLQAQTADLDIGLLVANHMWTPPATPRVLDMPLADHERMLDVNARAYLRLAHHFGRGFAARGRGGIILVSSGAGLVTTPFTGGYAANKAYQLALGEALWYELQGSGVAVQVLAPGLTRTQGDGMAGFNQRLMMDVDPVVQESLAQLGRRHLVIPGAVNKALMAVQTRLLPRRQAVKQIGRLMERGLNK